MVVSMTKEKVAFESIIEIAFIVYKVQMTINNTAQIDTPKSFLNNQRTETQKACLSVEIIDKNREYAKPCFRVSTKDGFE